MIDEDYKDFRAYHVLNSGEKEEIPDVEIDKVSELFGPEEVMLLVRFDLRRIFIWKGYKSPVRKRFISSRVSAGIQSECGDKGMHMKIISVDAGDEPIEFLKAFDVDPYEVDDTDRLQDMYYVRNSERQDLEDKELREKIKKKKKKKEKEGYYSPALDKKVKFGEDKKKEMAKSSKHQKELRKKRPVKKVRAPSRKKSRSRSRSAGGVSDSLSAKQKKKIKEKILAYELPDGYKRLNIIIGTDLYGPQKVVSKVFGKEVEETKWDIVGNVPDGKIDLDAGKIQAVCKDNKVQGLVVLAKGEGDSNISANNEKSEKKEEKSSKDKQKKSADTEANKESQEKEPKKSKKRELKPIPRGD